MFICFYLETDYINCESKDDLCFMESINMRNFESILFLDTLMNEKIDYTKQSLCSWLN